MKIYLIVLILIISCGSVFGQRETFKDADRLTQELSQAKSDTALIVLKCRLSEAYRSNNPDTSLILANQALEKSRDLGFKKGEVMALNALCVLYREKGNLPYALQLGLKAVKIAKEEQLIYEEVYALIRVANVYLHVRDASKALPYLKKADEILRNNYDDFQWSVTQYFIADSYEQINQLDSAEKRVEMLEQKYGSVPLWVIINNRLLGNVAVKKGEFPQAKAYFRKSLTEAIAETAFREAATASNAMAQIFKKLDQPDSSIFYAKQGLEFGEMLSYTNRILTASSLLAELYAEKDPKEAVRYYQIASAAKDSLYGVQKFQQLQSATMEEQERQNEIEAAAIAFKNSQRQRGLLAGVAVFLFVAILLYRNNRQKQKTNKVLETTLDNLKSTQAQLIQSEKMASLGELTAGIAHEIQNPLNFVNNFSEVNEELLVEMMDELGSGKIEEAIALANDALENQKKINHHGKRADGIVKGMLQHSRSSNGVKEPTDINALAEEYFKLAYHSYVSKEKLSTKIKLVTDLDANLPLVNVIPQEIGRVLLNLYNNAFWACAERSLGAVGERLSQGVTSNSPPDSEMYIPTITLSTKHLGDKIEIHVRDNGPGIPPNMIDKIFQPFFTTKPTGQGTGLGLSLAYDIIKAHRGTITVSSFN